MHQKSISIIQYYEVIWKEILPGIIRKHVTTNIILILSIKRMEWLINVLGLTMQYNKNKNILTKNSLVKY